MLRSLDFDFAVAPARRSLETLGISSGGATSGAIRREEFPHVAPLAALHLTQTWLEHSIVASRGESRRGMQVGPCPRTARRRLF